jgi:AraC-like DNA-binding protein
MRSLYPTISAMEAAAFELTGRYQMTPFFKQVRIDHSSLINNISSLHKAIYEGASMLECESRLLWTLTQLIDQHADNSHTEKSIGNEKNTIRRARDYIDSHFATGVSLQELAQYVGLSPYYFLRVFRAEVGMPPYAYLESVRIGRAQRLIESGKSLTEAAFEAGFSSQSHMTNRFKKIIGVTPGHYALQVRPS